jgi:hypothetical protein
LTGTTNWPTGFLVQLSRSSCVTIFDLTPNSFGLAATSVAAPSRMKTNLAHFLFPYLIRAGQLSVKK